MTKNNKTWEDSHEFVVVSCCGGDYCGEDGFDHNKELKAFIASQIEKARYETVDYIAKKYGDDFTDGCGCCMERTLNEELKKELDK